MAKKTTNRKTQPPQSFKARRGGVTPPPPPVAGESVLVEVGFPSAGVSALSITPEIANAVRAAGYDPLTFNRLTWPVGAANYARAHVLVSDADMNLLGFEGGSPEVSFKMGDATFAPMQVRNPRPILYSQAGAQIQSSVIYAVEVVDRRFEWQGRNYRPEASPELGPVGFNVTTANKSVMYEETIAQVIEDVQSPFTIREALEHLFAELPNGQWCWPSSGPDVADLNQRLDEDRWRDLLAFGYTVPELIDKLCMMAGCVMMFRPSETWPKYRDCENVQIEVVRIADGEGILSQELQAHSDDVIAGGVYSLPDSYSPPPSGAGYIASAGLSAWLRNEVPAFVDVLSPRAIIDGTYAAEHDAAYPETWALGRWYRWSTSFGRPTGLPSYDDGRPLATSTFYALYERQPDNSLVLTNQTDIVTLSSRLATYYYDRFRAGACDILFRGIVPLVQWPGAQTIEWRLDPERGPVTRAVGTVDAPILGFNATAPLRAIDVQGIGGARAMVRPDNGLTIDTREASTQRCHYGRITAVFAGPSYSAEAYDDPGINVVDQIPLRMGFSGVDVTPASVGDPCHICIRGEPDAGQRDLIVYTEGRLVTDCETAAQPAGFFGMNKVLHALGVTR